MSFDCRKRATLLRVAAILAVGALVLVVGSGQLSAEEWPAFTPAPKPGSNFRGPGFYLNWIKILACWSVFLAWVKTTDWVSVDCQEIKLDYLRWNPIVFGTFMLAFVLVWLIPSFTFWLAFPLLLIAYVAPLATYIIYRNGKVDNNRRVLTPEHLRYWFATHMTMVGVKMEAEKLDPHEIGPVKVFAQSGIDERTDNARLLLARQSPGLTTAREILAEGMVGRATAFMLDYTQQATAVRTMIDGVWIPAEPRGRDVADPALESFKLLCGLNPQDRQNRQEGTFVAEYESKRYNATFVSQGTANGERVLIQFAEGKIPRRTLDDLGMRTKVQEQLREMLELPRGIVLFSAIPGGGLRSTMDAVLHGCDRFTREFATLEEETNRYQEVENVPVTTYNAADASLPLSGVLVKFFRTEPNVVVLRDLIDGEMVEFLCDQIADDRLIITTIRAKDCAEALSRVLALGVPPGEFAKVISAVVNQRLIRKLCDSCKEAYAPTPQVLQQLGIPEGRVQAFYRPFQPNPQEPKEPCRACGGIGYLGRTAIFELMSIGDTVRNTLAGNPKPEQIRQAARKEGTKSLQEEGVLLVAKGVTSLPELMRVLKQ